MAEKLAEYRRKRDFERTGEPSGEKRVSRSGGNRKLRKFVVQYHIATRNHYDFRLEWRGTLLSWAVPKGPSYNPSDKRLAVMVEDHPLEYANFEGLIPKGQYGGGTVMLWDEGFWEPQADFGNGLDEGSLKIILRGSRLKGKWALVRLRDREDEEKKNWLLIKEDDEFAQGSDGISEFKTSIRTGRTIAEINGEEDLTVRRNPMRRADVQLAKLAEEIPEGDGWLYEVKYDGYRILAFVEGGETRLMTRNDKDFTSKFAGVAAALSKWSGGRAMVLDGEMVVADERGGTDFQALQNYLKEPGGKALVYMVFDLLALDGEDLREHPLIERKERLAELLKGAPACLGYSNHVVGRGKESFRAAQESGFEGIVGKRSDSVYRGDRNGDWIKLKCYRRQEFVIGGYTRTQKKASGVSAVLLGVYEGEELRYAGRAGTGMSLKGGRELEKEFQKLLVQEAPFSDPPRGKSDEERFWLRPELIAEVQFAEWTEEKVLRQASFKGLRTDKEPREVVMEQTEQEGNPGGEERKIGKSAAKKSSARAEEAGEEKASKALDSKESKKGVKPVKRSAKAGETLVCGIPVTSPERVIFSDPEVKKLDLLRYYEKVSKRMLPYAGGRILSVVRCHKGVSSACFFKKHPSTESEGVEVIPVRNSEGEMSDYFYLENEKGLISEAQLGSIEFHIWGSRIETLEKPDMMVFDLDPDEGMSLERVRQGVRDLKSILDELSLKSFLKVSGGKGYHVVVPFRPSAGWEEFKEFAGRISKLMESKWPDRYTSNIRKEKRRGKILIDFFRNGRGATSVAPYSLRARPGAKVSMPISWRELGTVAPNGIDLCEALNRLKKSDPWRDFFKADQSLK